MVPTSPYKAPFSNEDTPESQRIPGAYIVWLRPGYSFEQHKATVSQAIDVDKHTRKVDTKLSPGQTIYDTFDVGEEALDVIRADSQVALLEYDAKAWEDDMPA